jgi:hypothetical protein
MSLYNDFTSLTPHLQSIRKLKDYLVFDFEIPTDWKVPKKFVQEDKFFEQESQNDGTRLFSFVSDLTEDSTNLVVKNLQGIIKYNVELQEKENLLQSKINELQSIFEKNNLKTLKTLKFDVKTNKVEIDNGKRNEITDLVGKGEE